MDSDVQKIKDRINIVDVVGQYVQLKRAGRTYMARCPFHKERTASFHVSPERGTYKCFGCGEGGDIFTFVEKMDGIDFSSALKLLADKAGVKLERRFTKSPEQKEHDERLLEVCEEATVFFEKELEKRKDVQNYIHTRGVEDDTKKTWRLGYAPAQWEALSSHLEGKGFSKTEIVDAGFAIKSEKQPGKIFDRFRGRIMFPIFDALGQPIATSGRFFEKVPGQKDDVEPAKYVNSPETVLFRKSRVLYGLDRARGAIRKLDCILLVEGQFDLILSHQSGLPLAVALSGTALTEEHLSILGRLSKRLVLALDADQAGIRAGLKSALMAFAAGFDVKVPTFQEGKDPADVAKENPELLKAAVRTSRTAVEFFMDALQPTAKDERAYKKIVEEQVLPLIAAMRSQIDQAHFIHLVAQKLSVPDAAVAAEVSKRLGTSTTRMQEEKEEEISAGPKLTSLEKYAGMLLFALERNDAAQARLRSLLGADRRAALLESLLPEAEFLRFAFEAEVGEGALEATVAEDMFKRIELLLLEERMAAAGSDTKVLMELARRREELRK